MSFEKFQLTGCDTDSIMFCKQDQSTFTESERAKILETLNALFPENIIWEDDGLYPSVLVIKTKNYALYDGDKVSIKGSALKATTKEPALREMLHRMINSLLNITNEDLKDVYLEYVKEACKIKDIKRWGAKKSVTTSVLNPQRTNEQKLYDAIEGKGYQIGEKFFVYFRPDDTLAVIDDFDGEYNVDKVLEKLYKTVDILKTVLPVKEMFPNYKLKKNKKELDKILGNVILIKKEGSE